MDKNTVTGFILIALVVIGFSWYSRPSEAELRQMAVQDSIAAAERLQAEAEQRQKAEAAEASQHVVPDSSSLFFAHRQGADREIILQNNKVKLTLSTLGGTVRSAEILGYKSRNVEGDVQLMN